MQIQKKKKKKKKTTFLTFLLSRQIYSNYTAILPYTYLGRVERGEDGGRREERSKVKYCMA